MRPATIDMGIEVVTIPVADVEPGSAQRFEVGDLFHFGPSGFEPGPDPERASYRTFASFEDPDDNSWLLQEVTERNP